MKQLFTVFSHRYIALIGLSLFSMASFATPSLKVMNIHVNNTPITKVVQSVNKQCGTSVDATLLQAPQQRVSFDFSNIRCDTVIMLIAAFDANAT